MRPALIFAIRVFLPALMLVYVLAMLASSCMPLSDTMGAAQAIPRWEFWLLYASVPSVTWWQWTGGLQPISIADRLPILLLAFLWVWSCWIAGKQICKLDPISKRLSKYESIGVSIWIGQSTLSILVFVFGAIIGVWLLVWLWAFLILAGMVLLRFQSSQSVREPAIEPLIESVKTVDSSFSSSIQRRMVGLLILATAYLGCIAVFGATIPTQDLQVRELDWWMTKQAALEGKIRWSTDHAMANGPAGLNMSSMAFVSLLTIDLPMPSSQQNQTDSLMLLEKWHGRLLIGVLAGKTTNAMLCLVGIFLASVHLGRRRGFLSGLFVCFLLVATPGISELTRLGRTEVLIGVWCAVIVVVWQASRTADAKQLPLGLVWGLLLSGVLSSGYGPAILVGLPAIALRILDGWQMRHAIDCRATKPALAIISICVALSASPFYLRNTIASGDPIYPWGRIVAQQMGWIENNEFKDSILFAYRVPSMTIAESISAIDEGSEIENSDQDRSPYRMSNLWDGLFRILGGSNAHGLMLIPGAAIGLLVGRFSFHRVAILWFVYWIAIWWSTFTRQDRDWVGVLIVLAWPAASGSQWLVERVHGYFMMLLVSIAITWSVVAIPVWPTSDNRILVSLETLSRKNASTSVGAVEREMESDSMRPLESNLSADYLGAFNAIERSAARENRKETVLLVGESDDFDLLSECKSNGPFDVGLLDKCSNKSTNEMVSILRFHDVSHVLIVWTGVQYRERLTGRKMESEYRSVVSKLIYESHLEPIPWGINSSQAELFRVNE